MPRSSFTERQAQFRKEFPIIERIVDQSLYSGDVFNKKTLDKEQLEYLTENYSHTGGWKFSLTDLALYEIEGQIPYFMDTMTREIRTEFVKLGEGDKHKYLTEHGLPNPLTWSTSQLVEKLWENLEHPEIHPVWLQGGFPELANIFSQVGQDNPHIQDELLKGLKHIFAYHFYFGKAWYMLGMGEHYTALRIVLREFLKTLRKVIPSHKWMSVFMFFVFANHPRYWQGKAEIQSSFLSGLEYSRVKFVWSWFLGGGKPTSNPFTHINLTLNGELPKSTQKGFSLSIWYNNIANTVAGYFKETFKALLPDVDEDGYSWT